MAFHDLAAVWLASGKAGDCSAARCASCSAVGQASCEAAAQPVGLLDAPLGAQVAGLWDLHTLIFDVKLELCKAH